MFKLRLTFQFSVCFDHDLRQVRLKKKIFRHSYLLPVCRITRLPFAWSEDVQKKTILAH